METERTQSPSISLKQLKHGFSKWLTLVSDEFIDVIIAVVIANRLSADPTWMLIVGPPSSAKTEILRALNELENTYFLSTLTPQTLISGQKAKSGDHVPSLLFKLDGKTVVMKDFTTILTMRREPRAEIFSQLREIYDGQFSKAFGTGQTISWEGKIGFIAGVTPIIDRYSAIHQVLGERFLQYRVKAENPLEIARHAKRMVNKETEMRKELSGAVANFFKGMSGRLNLEFQTIEEIDEKLLNLACFCAVARTGVPRDRISKVVEIVPIPEGPARLTKQLTQIGIGLAIAHNKTAIDADIYEIVKKIGRDILPGMRLLILETMWRKGLSEDLHGWENTRGIAELAGIPTTTMKEQLENLHILKLINRRLGDEDGAAANTFFWQLALYAIELIQASDIFETKAEDDPSVPF